MKSRELVWCWLDVRWNRTRKGECVCVLFWSVCSFSCLAIITAPPLANFNWFPWSPPLCTVPSKLSTFSTPLGDETSVLEGILSVFLGLRDLEPEVHYITILLPRALGRKSWRVHNIVYWEVLKVACTLALAVSCGGYLPTGMRLETKLSISKKWTFCAGFFTYCSRNQRDLCPLDTPVC